METTQTQITETSRAEVIKKLLHDFYLEKAHMLIGDTTHPQTSAETAAEILKAHDDVVKQLFKNDRLQKPEWGDGATYLTIDTEGEDELNQYRVIAREAKDLLGEDVVDKLLEVLDPTNGLNRVMDRQNYIKANLPERTPRVITI